MLSVFVKQGSLFIYPSTCLLKANGKLCYLWMAKKSLLSRRTRVHVNILLNTSHSNCPGVRRSESRQGSNFSQAIISFSTQPLPSLFMCTSESNVNAFEKRLFEGLCYYPHTACTIYCVETHTQPRML